MLHNMFRTGIGIPGNPATLGSFSFLEVVPLLQISDYSGRKAGGDPGSAGKGFIIAI